MLSATTSETAIGSWKAERGVEAVKFALWLFFCSKRKQKILLSYTRVEAGFRSWSSGDVKNACFLDETLLTFDHSKTETQAQE